MVEVRSPDLGHQIWLATYQGVCRMDADTPGRNWAPVEVVVGEASKSLVVYQLQTDRKGRVYVFTTTGVYRLTAQPGKAFAVDHFTTGNGLPSNGCTAGSTMVDSKGRIWTGTVAGAAVFDPAMEMTDRSPKPLLLERVLAGGREQAAGTPFQVPWRHTATHFQFSLLSFTREEDTRFRTQLVGLEEAPTPWGREGRREFPALPQGHYTFQVWGRDHAGNLSGPLRVAFQVLPPPWATWWAYLLYGLLGVGFLMLGIRTRTRLLEARTRELEAAVDLRTQQLAETVEDLKEARNVADRANQAKSFLMATMSHEIRTPIQGVIGLSDMLLASPLSPSQKDVAATLHQSTEALLAILNDLLDYSKLEAGHLQLERAPFDLVRTLEDGVALFVESAHAKGLEIATQLEPALPTRVMGDAARLRQVVMNYLGNAIKFTASGHVVLEATAQASPSGPRLVISVVDSGLGIPRDRLDQLSTPYPRVDPPTYRKWGGRGLGRAFCKRVAEARGGDVGVESVEGQGSTFWVNLPLVADEAERNGPPLVNVRVLAFEPQAQSRKALDWHLQALGVQVTWADTLVDLTSRWMGMREDGMACHAVLASTQGLGVSLDTMVSSLLRMDPELPLVLVTQGRGLGELESLDAHGGVRTLVKPLRRRGIQELLAEALGLVEAIPEAPVGSKGQVLVVDDNETNRKIARFHLQALGYACTAVESGEEALEILSRNTFHTVLMDCEMPGLSGFETTRRIRARESEGRHLRILAMTAHSVEHAGTRSQAAGMDGILLKPLRRDALVQALEEGGVGPEEGAAHALGVDGLDEHTWSGLEYLEKTSGAGAIAELAEDFRLDARPRLARLQKAVEDGARDQVRRLAHDLKSNSATLGAVKLALVAKRIEYTSLEAPLEELRDLVILADQELDRALQAIAQRLKEP